MKPSFENSLSILVQAYFNGTLEHANCSACAVGNLIAHAKGLKPVPSSEIKPKHNWRFSDGSFPEWQRVFCSDIPGVQSRRADNYYGAAKEQIDSTGYSWKELARIEEAFELASDRGGMDHQSDAYKDKQRFDGLMKVVDVLADIHQVDLSIREEAKAMFVKTPAI